LYRGCLPAAVQLQPRRRQQITSDVTPPLEPGRVSRQTLDGGRE
jgi:hypothetical protein